MTNLNSLFLSQAYNDCWDDYNRSLKLRSFPRWDYVILTASNEQQAEGFRKQIEDRQNFLPKGTKFVAIPDRDGRRVGSGGATLEVLRYLHEQEESFDSLRVLVIHSGGDSKRVPQYSALGKLFSPVPHELSNGRSSTLFDEFMICMSSVPSRIREGMVLLSGDVLLLFNPLQIDYNNAGAAAISFKENVETGKNHGVYLNGPDGNVKCCLQKKSVEVLREAGAVNESGCVDIDTGALIFSTDIMKSLYSLIETDADYDRNVNERTRLSLYADFLYPLASDSTLEDFYREKPEGEFCPELTAARTRVWEVLRPYRMKLLRLAPAKFIHFGTTREILELMNGGVDEYHYLGWSRKVGSSIRSDVSGYNSVLSSRSSVGKDCYLEASYVHGNSRIGSHSVLSYIDVQDQVKGITSGLEYITSMPGLQQQLQVAHIELSPQTKKELDERFVLIYTGQRRLARNLLRDVVGRYVGNEPDSLFALEEIQKTAVLIDCCTIILIPVSLKCGDTGVIYRLSFLSIRQRLSRWRLIRSRNTIVERTEEIPSATGSAKKAAFAPKKEGRTAALITKRDFLVTESASPVFGHSRAVSPSTKTYWKLSGMIISV